jgi:hypothetical protein
MSKGEASAFVGLLTEQQAAQTCQAINFFSSKLEDLSLVSKYRVVTLPTVIALDAHSRVIFRMVHNINPAEVMATLSALEESNSDNT